MCAVSQAGYHTGLFFSRTVSFDEFYVYKIIKIPSSIFFFFLMLGSPVGQTRARP